MTVMVLMSFVVACGSDDPILAAVPETSVAVNAAFVNLDYVDVYSEDGEHVAVINRDVDFQETLSVGRYLMDFVSASGEHSLLPDERVAFAPFMQGGTPIDSVLVDGFDNPLWSVEVHPDLEANAHFTMRLRDMDASLEPWKQHFELWGEAPNPDWDHGFDPNADNFRAMSANHNSTTDRLRVTWEASYATYGDFTGACSNSHLCWDLRSGGYGYWDKDMNGTGYIDSDTSAWSNALSSYTCSFNSCANGCFGPCSISVDTSNARNYTCQNSAGTCTAGSGSTATKPRGGQCKMFSNLVFWRSGEYNNWGPWKKIPSDNSGWMTASPLTTAGTMSVGDVLRRPNGHAAIIVAVDTSNNTALISDSNWTNGDGNEYIGWRILGFSGSGNDNLGNYKRLNCLYDATPC